MPANFPGGLFNSEADKCFGVCMLINPWSQYFFADNFTRQQKHEMSQQLKVHSDLLHSINKDLLCSSRNVQEKHLKIVPDPNSFLQYSTKAYALKIFYFLLINI
jgi:hypothetical protein